MAPSARSTTSSPERSARSAELEKRFRLTKGREHQLAALCAVRYRLRWSQVSLEKRRRSRRVAQARHDVVCTPHNWGANQREWLPFSAEQALNFLRFRRSWNRSLYPRPSPCRIEV